MLNKIQQFHTCSFELNLYTQTVKMSSSTFPLLGLLVGAFPTLQSPTIPLSKKLVPFVITILVLANVDWNDGSFIVFWGFAVTSNWIFQNDIPNRLVDRMMRKIKETIEAAGNKLEDKIVHDFLLKI